MLHILRMEKSSARIAGTGQSASLGRAADGVVILRPAVGPKHFTQSQIEKTVDTVRDARSGQFVERAPDSRNRKGR
jgi:hypothetical protein